MPDSHLPDSHLPDSHRTEFTGERVIPGEVDGDLWNEHLSRYVFARQFAAGQRVLDLGCGSGYGSALLAEVAAQVTGIDTSEEAVAYAREHYGAAQNLTFETGNAMAGGPVRAGVITAFEVIEHVDDWPGMLRAAREQLAEGGLLLVSTPNKPYYAEARGESGANPYHVHEFEFAEFLAGLREHFAFVTIFAQNHAAGIAFSSLAAASTASSSVRSRAGWQAFGPARVAATGEAHFFLAVCSQQPREVPDRFFYIPEQANLLRERERHIRLLRDEVALKTQWLEARNQELRDRNREYEVLLTLHTALRQDVEARNEWARRQDVLLRERGSRIEALQAELEAAHSEFAAHAAAYEAKLAELEESNRSKTEWVRETERRLSGEAEERGRQLADCVALLDRAEKTVEERTLWAQRLSGELSAARERYAALRRSPVVRAAARLGLVVDRT